jgi:hypothetical protein
VLSRAPTWCAGVGGPGADLTELLVVDEMLCLSRPTGARVQLLPNLRMSTLIVFRWSHPPVAQYVYIRLLGLLLLVLVILVLALQNGGSTRNQWVLLPDQETAASRLGLGLPMTIKFGH